MRLISFDLCPYVQRSTIVLEEKGVEHEITYIDLADKPDWFVAISPHGRVPVLQVGDAVLFESLAIVEYLDETTGPRLHPADPLARARDRAWFPVTDSLNAAAYHMMVAADLAAVEAQAAKAKALLAKLEGEVAGPLWRGEAFTLMDAVAYPALQRLVWLEAIYPHLDLFAEAPKVAGWERALRERPSVQRSTVPDIEVRLHAALRAISPAYRQTHPEA